jgi:hypothetical protein
MLKDEHYARLRNPTFRPMFKLEKDDEVSNGTHGSFLLDVYDRLYVKMKKRLKINIPTIDFNLIRLRRCINKVAVQRGHLQTMLTIDELPLALEFYLQIDGLLISNRTSARYSSSLFGSGYVLSEDMYIQWRATTCLRQSTPRRCLLHRSS